jgi:sirohydrochlorin cobaltochelatase
MTRTALILAAHGAGDGSAVNRRVRDLARQVQTTGAFDDVRCAFNLGAPGFAQALDDTLADAVTVVPLMTSNGYFSQTMLPRELARSSRFPRVEIRITPPVGTHAAMADLVTDRVTEAMTRFSLDPRDTALLVVGHGTEQHRTSRQATNDLRDVLGARSVCARVEAAFLSEEPRLEHMAHTLAQFGGGDHATTDIPTRLGIDGSRPLDPPVWGRVGSRFVVCTEAPGADSSLVKIICDLAREAARSEPSHGR